MITAVVIDCGYSYCYISAVSIAIFLYVNERAAMFMNMYIFT